MSYPGTIIGPNDQGKEYVVLKAAAARTKGDIVKIGSSAEGLVDVALADDTTVYRIAVAAQDIPSGAYGLYQIKGRCTVTTPSITSVAGQALHVVDGAVAASGATAEKPNGVTSQNDFCVVMTAASSSTSHDVFLYGDPITGQT